MLQLTLRRLPNKWDICESERASLSQKIKGMMLKETVYSSTAINSAASGRNNHICSLPARNSTSNSRSKNSNSSSNSSCSSSSSCSSCSSRWRDHDNNYDDSVAEFFDDTMNSLFSKSFVKRNNIRGFLFARDKTSQTVVKSSTQQMMCEWSYRVVDYIDGSRELVAISQNYLNRFLREYDW
jgi:hypothetical protein